MADAVTTRRAVLASLVANLTDLVTNLAVMLITGSAIIFAEFARGGADALGSLLLWIGYRRALRPRSREHPLGHGREAFFWALLSALVLLVLGGGLGFWRGFDRLADPVPVSHGGWAVAVLCLSLLTNGYAVRQSLRRLGADGRSPVQAFRESDQPLVNTALLQDSLGLTSSVFGLVAMLVYLATGIVLLDAIGALVIGALVVVFALLLISQARALIAGRAVPRRMAARIVAAARALPEVVGVNRATAVHAGEGRIRVDLDLDLREGLTTTEIEAVLDRVEAAVTDALPTVAGVRIDLNSPPDTSAAR